MDAEFDMEGKTVLVTGASSGIGLAACQKLAAGGALVVMACRDPARAEAAREQVAAAADDPLVEVGLVDLASQASVRAFAAWFLARFDRLDVLVNNAGIYTSRRRLTVDGVESTLAVNHVSHFLLTNLLIDRLKSSAPARVVTVASAAHRSGRIHLEDMDLARGWRGWRSYAQSKLANVLFTRELARRLEGTGVVATAVHPGVVRTRWAHADAGFLGILVRLGAPLMRSPRRGADTVVWAAASPEAAGLSGAYLVDRRPRRPHPRALDDAMAARLWDWSVERAGLASVAPG